jgi:hypothetical protein
MGGDNEEQVPDRLDVHQRCWADGFRTLIVHGGMPDRLAPPRHGISYKISRTITRTIPSTTFAVRL